MRMKLYRLKGREPVLITDPHPVLIWGQMMEGTARFVRVTVVGRFTASTVFLGMNHRWHGDGPPLLFETMIFGPDRREVWSRTPTWDAAELAHASAVARLKEDDEAAPYDVDPATGQRIDPQ